MISAVVAYSSSSDDEEQTDNNESRNVHATYEKISSKKSATSSLPIPVLTCQKRNSVSQDRPPEQDQRKRQKKAETVNENSLPVPSAIQNLYDTDDDKLSTEDPSKHGGRVRSFEHVEGNWATFVYIPVNPDARLLELFTSLVKCLRPMNFEMMSNHHVTLSRTVVIRHHWIDSLMESLRESLSPLVSCICDVLEPRLYTNDEKTRTFLCLELQREGTNLSSYVAAVDKCFDEFRLQPYYQDPSFHISIGWCLGDVLADVSLKKIQQMKDLMEECFQDNPDLSVLDVREIECKTGKKVFRFPLQEDDR